jgi:hypothetical protein
MGKVATIHATARRSWSRLGAPVRVAALGLLALGAVYAVGASTSPSAQEAQKAAPGGETPKPPAGTPSTTTAWIDSTAKLVGSLNWAWVALVLLIVFRKSVAALLEALKTALADRAVTFDVASVKIQVSERGSDPWEERSPGFSRSLLEIEEAPVRERSSILSEIAPQLLFPLSSYMARRWVTGAPGAAAAKAMQAARDTLRAACEAAHTFPNVRRHLLTFVQPFVEARFFEADRFGELLARYPVLADGIRALEPRDLAQDPDDFLILHAAGVAYAQREDWAAGSTILEAILWKEQQPLYPRAADTWLACAYHSHLEKAQKEKPGVDIESAEFFDAIDSLLRRAERVAGEMRAMPGSGYYLRELLKVIGSIASILGERSRTPEKKARYFDEALRALVECTGPIDGDPPSPLDHNNLADLYRQMGDLHRQIGAAQVSAAYDAKAHREVDLASPSGDPSDPAFENTRALIFAGEKQALKGLLALERYGEAAAAGADRPDLVQYVENQILAAKLAAAVEADLPAGCLGLTTAKLEAARGFVERQREQLGAAADELQAQIEELLGYAYLQVPGHESRAVDAYGRLGARGDNEAADVRWRRQLGRAKALSRLAGSQRRAFSVEAARRFWKDAFAGLASSGTAVKAFGLEAGVASVPRRVRHLRLRLDTVIALQAVAEEGVREGERLDARNLVDQETEILASLRTALSDLALQLGLGGALTEVESQVRECAARRCYVLGRILIRDDPSFNDAGLVDKVETNFAAARGAGADLDCRIDLELGEFLLAAAAAGKGDLRVRYEQAVASLERAAGRNAPALRAETVRALAEAYAWRPTILKKARASKPAS